MITFEEALNKAQKEAARADKVVVSAKENAEWWRFDAERTDGQHAFDDGAGSVYVNKQTGEIRKLQLWDVDFTAAFNETATSIDLA